jgi:hypothetical protein
MSQKLELLSNKLHKNLKIIVNNNFSHLSHMHVAPITIDEFSDCSADLPLVFMKKPLDDSKYIPVALLGLKKEENLVIENGLWKRNFLPAAFSHYPLSLTPHPDYIEKFIIRIDLGSKLVSESEGQALFNSDGTDTQFLNLSKNALSEYYRHVLISEEFMKTIKQLRLLEAGNFTVTTKKETRNVSGIYIINEKKLNQLSEEKFSSLRKKGYLMPIYAHLLSLKQTQRLVDSLESK